MGRVGVKNLHNVTQQFLMTFVVARESEMAMVHVPDEVQCLRRDCSADGCHPAMQSQSPDWVDFGPFSARLAFTASSNVACGLPAAANDAGGSRFHKLTPNSAPRSEQDARSDQFVERCALDRRREVQEARRPIA
jgi:hypothetical protein